MRTAEKPFNRKTSKKEGHMGKHLLTPEFRVSYPSVFKAKKNQLSGKMEFSLQGLFQKEYKDEANKKAYEALKAAIQTELEDTFGKDPKKWPAMKDAQGAMKLRLPLRDQADRAKEDDKGNKFLPDGYQEGAKYLNLKNERAPAVVKKVGGRTVPITDENEFYAGCYAVASVDVKAWKHPSGTWGVSVWLQNICKTRDGEPFGNRTLPENDFSQVTDTEGAVMGAGDTASDVASLFG